MEQCSSLTQHGMVGKELGEHYRRYKQLDDEILGYVMPRDQYIVSLLIHHIEHLQGLLQKPTGTDSIEHFIQIALEGLEDLNIPDITEDFKNQLKKQLESKRLRQPPFPANRIMGAEQQKNDKADDEFEIGG